MRNRQFEGKGRPFPGSGAKGYFTAMLFDHNVHERQPEPGAMIARQLAAFLALIAIKQIGDFFRSNAFPLVAYSQARLMAGLKNLNVDDRSGWAVLHGVGQKVDHGTFKQFRISFQP